MSYICRIRILLIGRHSRQVLNLITELHFKDGSVASNLIKSTSAVYLCKVFLFGVQPRKAHKQFR